jgi:hypothetical protein
MHMSFARNIDLSKLDSMTKYPSIETYHPINPVDGMLHDQSCFQFTGTVVATEKIDGCNARIIMLPDGSWILGSRGELLYGENDLIINPAHNIVATLSPFARHVSENWQAPVEALTVFYGEVYGKPSNAGAWGNYTADKNITGFRLFDVMQIEHDMFEQLHNMPKEAIALWRERSGGQGFHAEPGLQEAARRFGFELAPRVWQGPGHDLPTDLRGMLDWMLDKVPVSQAPLSPSGAGTAEGVVLRSWARSIICKARFADYARALRQQTMQAPVGG